MRKGDTSGTGLMVMLAMAYGMRLPRVVNDVKLEPPSAETIAFLKAKNEAKRQRRSLKRNLHWTGRREE